MCKYEMSFPVNCRIEISDDIRAWCRWSSLSRRCWKNCQTDKRNFGQCTAKNSKMNEKTTASRRLNDSFRENRNIEQTQSQGASSSKLSRREILQYKYPKIYPNPSIENGYELRKEENLKGKLRWQRFRTKLFYRIGRIKWSIRIEVTRNIHWNVSVG